MEKAKGFTNFSRRAKILGLELLDFFFLVTAFLLIFLFSKNLIVNLALLGVLYGVLRAYKRGKPPHWTQSLVRFVLTPKRFPEGRELDQEVYL